MKALVITEAGKTGYTSLPKPVPAPGEVLLQPPALGMQTFYDLGFAFGLWHGILRERQG